MKKIRYTKFFGWFAAAILLLTTSCKDDMFGNGSSDEVAVTFTLTPEAAAPLATRAIENGHVHYPGEGEYPHISDGSKADMLIYAVYEKKADGKYELLEGYSDGTDEELKELGFDHGDGQTIKKITEFPVTVTLTLKRGATYSVAFWAQSSKTKAYDTSDLRKVEVIYSELNNSTGNGSDDDNIQKTDVKGESSVDETTTPNNDEFRDAFCKSVEFTAGENGLEQDVLLYRPLAQINVGTSGYDFETITRNANKKYLYSKIRLNRVARYLNVVEDKTYSSTTDEEHPYDGEKTAEAFAVADFGYAPIPAYTNWPEKEADKKESGYDNFPQYPSYTTWDWDYNDNYVFPHEGITRENYEGEEFLKVHLYEDNDIEDAENYTEKEGDYLGYANLTNYSDHLSETFKYLSMCYVLTSSTKEEAITINNIKVWMATEADGTDETLIVDLNNVPAQRNWRTNIIGNLLTEKNTFSVKLDRDFAGEYSAWGQEWAWSGPLAKGVYYDAANDEIQISDKDGLIWFQKMVNGKMTIRETFNGENIGKYYTYYDDTHNDPATNGIDFEYDGIADPTTTLGADATPAERAAAENLKARILKATHQDMATSNKGKWPTNGNFHFYGTNGPAKVKLMADIDLSNEEWIPIGFDGRILETVNIEFTETVANNRGFYGVFDGNNHTISNLKTKRFSATVPLWSEERSRDGNDKKKYVDNFQWFGRGLFGEIGGDAKIMNVRLFNPDIYGCHGVGGIVGIAYGGKIEITNCVVDGGSTGSLIVTPMYRGDTTSGGYNERNRTFARGVYLGGIVGYFNTVGGRVDNCEVKNLYMRGYRRVGGLIGSVDLAKTGSAQIDPTAGTDNSKSNPASISNNRISNVVLIASQFSTFGLRHRIENDVYKTGFGWDAAQYNLYAQRFVGGDTKDYVDKNTGKTAGNVANGLTFSEFTEDVDTKGVRNSNMQTAPLKYMPILSSWFSDNIMLNANYYGEPSAKTLMNTHKFKIFSSFVDDASGDVGAVNNQYSFPMALPGNVEIDWVVDDDESKSKNVGLYVESVTLDGKNGIGGRSVITPNDVQNEGECALFVTARNRKEFYDAVASAKQGNAYYKAPTVIKNIVVRGEPYAYTGILLSPNENMEKIELENVAVYDVYQTLALNNVCGTGNQWPNSVSANGIEITAKKCNFRGYTVPGAGWSKITYTNTTFEIGTFTDHGDREKTCRVDAPTTFDHCYFKAPYIIRLADNNVEFTECYATSTSTKNVKLDRKEGCTRIVITSTPQGDPQVTYYNGTEEIK